MLRSLTGIASAALATCLTTPAIAGDGTIANGKLNILVYFAYQESNPDSWQPVFTAFSQLLFDATERNLQLGTVTFTRCSQLKERADVWILDDNSGARAHLNGLGVLGRHITISQVHKSTSGTALGQFGLCHEAGHYLWGVLDEYKGFVGDVETQNPDPLHYCSTDGSTVSCIMDGGTQVAPNNTRHAFCTTDFVATRHNNGINNAAGVAVKTLQAYHLGVSCWSRMATSGVGGLAEPTTEPVSDTTGHQAVDYRNNEGEVAIAMVIDRSGSMGGVPITLARQGAQLGVGLMKDGEQLAVVSFSGSATVNLSMRTLDATARAAANSAIGALTASGSTAIGSGLQAGQGQLNTVSGCAEIIVLLSDGFSNAGPSPASVVPTLVANKTKVYSIALGDSVDVAALTNVATATGGKFFAATTAAQLPAIFQRILVEVAGAVGVAEATEQTLASGSSSSLTGTVSTLAGELAVSLGYAAGSPLTLALRRPDGQIIDANNVGSFPGVSLQTSNVQQLFTISGPAQGDWVATVTAGGTGLNVSYNLLMFTRSRTLELSAQVGSAVFPAGIPVQVAVTAGWPVAGANVTARVLDPTGVRLPDAITLRDDGKASSGDQYANDGVYSTLFQGYAAGSGSYTFEIEVQNTNGTASTFTDCPPSVTGGEAGATATAIPPFRAVVAGSGNVSGVPATVAAGALTFGSNQALDGQRIDNDNLARTTVLDLELTAAPGEQVVLRELRLPVAADARPDVIGTLALHLDGNADGQVDATSVPIAMGQIQNGELVLTSGSGLLRLSDGQPRRVLLTLGNLRLPPQAAGLLLPPAGGGDGWQIHWWPLGLLTILVGLLWLRSQQREHGARPIGASVRPLAIATGGLLVATLVVSCGGGGGGSPARIAGDLTFQVRPEAFVAVGATTNATVAVTGTATSVTTKFE